MTSDLQGTTIAPQMGSWPSPKDLGTRLTVTLPNTGHATRSEADARPAILAMALPRFQARPNPRDHGATQEATRLPEAERIEGSMSLIEMDFDEFPETGPEIHSLVPEEWRDHDQSSEHSLPVKTGRRQPTSGRKNLRSRDRPLISGNLS